jgi:glycosyltransferase involved in cell wall biosynthesis
MKTLSIIIPAFNEAAFIATLLERVISVPTEPLGYVKEIIVVDDGSSDNTAELASCFSAVKVLRQHNQGKGAAVQNGVRQATGNFILVQDADLEYEPADYLPMLKALGGAEDVSVYGSRSLGVIRDGGWGWPCPGRHSAQGFGPWLANILLSLMTFILYGRWITDMLTAYKLYPIRVVQGFNVKTCGFETDHELTAKMIKAGINIKEIPIAYKPRSVSEGKKIRARDGLIAVWTLLRFRLVD